MQGAAVNKKILATPISGAHFDNHLAGMQPISALLDLQSQHFYHPILRTKTELRTHIVHLERQPLNIYTFITFRLSP